jgi:exodeoxyribonuclease-5
MNSDQITLRPDEGQELQAIALKPTANSALNPDQQAALESIKDWLKTPDSPFFVLQGYAGTGKTFTMQELLKSVKLPIVFTAPTNKATKVLRDTLTDAGYKPECATIYSLLGLRLEANGEVKEMTGPKDHAKLDLSSYRLVVVDEGSMINAFLMKYIHLVTQNYNVKFLFMGDPAQLPPVKELTSPIWSLECPKARLTKVMRHDNQILVLVTSVREKVDHPFPSITMISNNAEGEGVWKQSTDQWERQLMRAVDAGGFLLQSHSKVIAWRNITVDKYNSFIRNRIFGDATKSCKWLTEERVIFMEPAKDSNDEIVATTDDEGTIQRVVEDWHPLYKEFKTFSITIALDTGSTVTATVLHPESAHAHAAKVAGLLADAKLNGRRWRDFWAFKEAFHNLRHAYAITAHRAQGSTYDTAFVVASDVLLNQNRQEAFRCLYVACSRPKRRLIIC